MNSSNISLTFIYSYLSQRTQKTKVGSTFSELMSILFGVSQGSILESLLFITYLRDLFILNDHLDFGSFVDDATSFVSGKILTKYLVTKKNIWLRFLNSFHITVLKPMQRNFTFS